MKYNLLKLANTRVRPNFIAFFVTVSQSQTLNYIHTWLKLIFLPILMQFATLNCYLAIILQFKTHYC